MKKKITELIRISIHILMGIQIVLGALWIACNLGKVPAFEECKELLHMGETLQVDEYTGYLYPVLLKGALLVEGAVSIPACGMVYVIQLLTAFGAYRYLLRRTVYRKETNSKKLWKRIDFLALYILTIPVVLQVHMAVLTYSLGSSLFLFLMGKLLNICEEEEKRRDHACIKIMLLFLLCTQVCTDYIWLCSGAVIMGSIGYGVMKKKTVARLLFALAVSLIVTIGLNAMLQTPGCTGKIQKSPEATLMTRVVWPNYNKLSYFWKEEIRQNWDAGELMELSTYPEKVIYEFGPAMDEMFGYEEANNIYREMAKRTLEMDTRNIVLAVINDMAGYSCPPITVNLQLQGIGHSYAGWNYGRMKDYAPGLTAYYVKYALNAWIYIAVATIILILLSKRPKEWQPERERRLGRWQLLYCVAIVCMVNLWYVLTSGNMQDYKKVMVISVLWTVLVLGMMEKGKISKV